MKVGSKKHFLNARTNITLVNDVEGRGIMVANYGKYRIMRRVSFRDFVFDLDQGYYFQSGLFLFYL